MEKHLSGIKLESWLVSAGRASEPGAPLNVPPVPASNFIIGGGREYTRDDGSPTWEALEEVVGGLESGKAVAFASGMAAIAAVFDQLTAGAVVVLPDDCDQGVAGLAAAGGPGRLSEPHGAHHEGAGGGRREPAGRREPHSRRGHGFRGGGVHEELDPAAGLHGHAGPGQPEAADRVAAARVRDYTSS